MSKLVSIIIPTYGRPRLLKRAIQSVIRQTYKNIEIIVIDDNNPSSAERVETELLLQNYINSCEVLYLKHEKNKNGSAARNTGLSMSNGEYITFLDDDDEMLPNRIEKCVDKMESLDTTWGACYTDYKKYKRDGEINTCGETETGHLYVRSLMRSLYIGSGSNLFIRTKAVKEIGGYDESFTRNQDLEFMVRLSEHNKFTYLPEKTLIIHYDDDIRLKDKKQGKEAYEYLVSVDNFYLKKFEKRINKLSVTQKNKLYQYISLERFRYSIRYNMYFDSIKNCVKNKVGPVTFYRYCVYMLNRKITKKVYGFKL